MKQKRIFTTIILLTIAVGFGSEAFAQTCTPAAPDLVSWYSGDGNALDARSRNNGTLQNGATFGTGQNGQAFSFDGADDFVNIPDSSSLQSFTTQASIEGWINPQTNGSADQWVFAHRNPGFNESFSVRITAAGRLQLVLKIFAGGTIIYTTSDGALQFGQFQHFAVTVDTVTGTAKAYVNGSEVGFFGNAFSGQIEGASTNIIGAREPGDSLYKGLVDELTVYNRALSASEIAAIAGAGTAGKCKPTATTPPSGQVAWFAGDGNANDIAGTNNGTLQNGAAFAIGKVGQGFNFDGANDFVDVPNSAALNTQLFTMESWVFPTSYNSGGNPDSLSFIMNKESAAATQYLIGIKNNTVCFNGTGIPTGNFAFYIDGPAGLPNDCSGFVNGNAAVPLNAWSHVALTYDGANIRAFVNGTLTRTIPATGTVTSGNGTLQIGGRSNFNTSFLEGRIDESAFYNRALTQDEITSIFNAGIAGKLKVNSTPTGFADANLKYNTDEFSSQAVSVTVGDATISFPSVTSAGITQQIPLPLSSLPTLPSGISTGLTYDISTSAAFTGQPTVCFNVPALAAVFPNLRIYHLEGGVWTNRTAASGNTPANFCTSPLSSLSPFAIVQAVPTAAAVSIGGRVLTNDGRGLAKARVTLTAQSGETRELLTSSFGYYRFTDVAAGQSVILTVVSKRYRFAPQIVSVTDDLTDLNLTALP